MVLHNSGMQTCKAHMEHPLVGSLVVTSPAGVLQEGFDICRQTTSEHRPKRTTSFKRLDLRANVLIPLVACKHTSLVCFHPFHSSVPILTHTAKLFGGQPALQYTLNYYFLVGQSGHRSVKGTLVDAVKLWFSGFKLNLHSRVET